MPVIELTEVIRAPVEICFDLSRSIDLHLISTEHTNEKAIAGVTSGLIGLDESVTWQARHFGITQRLTTRITAFEPPHFFADEMQRGIFKRFRHEHFFEEFNIGTRMRDVFDYDSPFGPLGKLVDFIILKKYMTRLLVLRNEVIRNFAESDKWKDLLNG